MVNTDRYNPCKQKFFGVLNHLQSVGDRHEDSSLGQKTGNQILGELKQQCLPLMEGRQGISWKRWAFSLKFEG